jgi:hypothetical protein
MLAGAWLIAVVVVGQGGLFDDAAAPGDRASVGRTAWVAADWLDVLAEPDDAAFATATLPRGLRVAVLGDGPPGWLVVAPGPEAFSWIERAAVEEWDDGRARVTARAAAVRPGRDGAGLPAGVWTTLRRGEVVRLTDRPPLVLRQSDGSRRVWLAIEPPPEERRYVRGDGVAWIEPNHAGPRADVGPPADPLGAPRRLASRSGAGEPGGVPAIDPILLTVGPAADRSELSDGFAEALARAEARHRVALAVPIAGWRLDEIQQAYQALRARAGSSAEQRLADARLDHVARQQGAARVARALAALIARSRARDAEFEAVRRRLAELADGSERPYDARGLLQTTSTLVDGRRAYVLIDDDGRTAAYLLIPPGLSVDDAVAGSVGIRGDARFHSTLKARVITVRELVRIEDAP